MTRASCLYEGMLRHRRFEPIEIGFRYPIRFLYLDLSELDHVFDESRLWSVEAAAPAQFLRRDHLGPPAQSLAASIRHLLTTRLGRAPDGPTRLLCSPRYFGLLFNPLSLYYCFEEDGETLGALVAEVTNLPKGERHCYVLDLNRQASDGAESAATRQRATPKHLPGSPFSGMDINYEWRVRSPGPTLTLTIRSELSKQSPSTNREYEAPYSQADLVLNRRELNSASLRSAFWRAPLFPAQMLARCYWQAWRLRWRRLPRAARPRRDYPRDFMDPRLIEDPSLADSLP